MKLGSLGDSTSVYTADPDQGSGQSRHTPQTTTQTQTQTQDALDILPQIGV